MKITRMMKKLAAGIGLVMTVLGISAEAVPVTYTFTGSAAAVVINRDGQGVIPEYSFVNEPYVITLKGETANVVHPELNVITAYLSDFESVTVEFPDRSYNGSVLKGTISDTVRLEVSGGANTMILSLKGVQGVCYSPSLNNYDLKSDATIPGTNFLANYTYINADFGDTTPGIIQALTLGFPTTFKAVTSPSTNTVRLDFDGDGVSDLGCYDTMTGEWMIDKSTSGYWTTQYGYGDTLPVVGDFDGDGLCDYGTYHAGSGQWNIRQSKDGDWATQFGFAGTVPITGDFDGDKKLDFGCYYAPGGDWFIYTSSKGFMKTKFGYEGTIPVSGDFDGDGISDFGCYYPPDGWWYVYKSGSKELWTTQFGYTGTEPLVADFDGDGVDDFGCYHAESGWWYIYKSTTKQLWTTQFGYADTEPIIGDYDGDGTSDFGCFYPYGGWWYVYKSSTKSVETDQFGHSTTVAFR